MSDLPAEDLGYQAVVAEYFLGLRGAGLLLSPLDQELVAEWERRGVPVPVVCRGLRHGMAAAAEERRGPPRSLRALRLAVEDEWRAYQSGRVGAAPAPAAVAEGEAAARRLDEARERLAAGAAGAGTLAGAYREAHRALLEVEGRPGSPAERADAALAAADAQLLRGWLAALPRAERAALGARTRRLAGARRRGESPRAYRRSLRAHLLDLGRQAGLTWPGGSV
jgi:hypothetical protein